MDKLPSCIRVEDSGQELRVTMRPSPARWFMAVIWVVVGSGFLYMAVHLLARVPLGGMNLLLVGISIVMGLLVPAAALWQVIGIATGSEVAAASSDRLVIQRRSLWGASRREFDRAHVLSISCEDEKSLPQDPIRGWKALLLGPLVVEGVDGAFRFGRLLWLHEGAVVRALLSRRLGLADACPPGRQ